VKIAVGEKRLHQKWNAASFDTWFGDITPLG